jgi:hypothetical protein
MTAMKHLTDEQLNLELCKWLGINPYRWGFYYSHENGSDWTGDYKSFEEAQADREEVYRAEHSSDPERYFDGPDHINDLSSLGRIALIEAKLTDEQYASGGDDTFTAHLWNILERDDPDNHFHRLISATARQRVTAILLTVNPEVFQ